MTSRGPRRVLASALALAGVLLAATACQDSSADDPGGSDPPAPSTSTTESPVEVPEPTPSVEPADGVLIDVPGATMNGLKGYRHLADYGLVQAWGDDQSSVILSPNLTSARSLDAWAKEYAREHIGTKFAERLDDGVVAGQYSAWVLADTEDPLVDRRIYGVMYLDGAWTIDFAFYEDGDPRPLTEEERQQVIDRVVATFAPHRETP